MSFPEYSEYLDSKVQWIGLLPSHWEAAPLKWQLIANDGGVWGSDPEEVSDTEVLRSTDQTVDGKWRVSDPAKRFLTSKEKASAALKAGDLVVTKSSGSSLHIGKTTLVTSEMELKRYCYGNFMQRLRVKKSLLPVVLWYLMNNQICRKQLDLLSNSTTGLANLNGSLLGELLIPVAPIEEQTQIARFLDHETAKIDALIREQERLIELLQEKRQAVISHAVTKGLDPDVPMKDSGVEWLGEVPAHWRVLSVKRVAQRVATGGTPSGESPSAEVSGGINWFTPGDFSGDLVLNASGKKVSRGAVESGDAKLFPGGSVVVVGIGATLGKVALIRAAFSANQQINVIIPNSQAYNSFLAYSLIAQTEQMRVFSNASTIGIMNQEKTKEVVIAVPPLTEQREIIKRLDSTIEQLGHLVDQAKLAIKILQERRSALISAAVTGKIDVRNWQPPTEESAFDEGVRQAGMEVTA